MPYTSKSTIAALLLATAGAIAPVRPAAAQQIQTCPQPRSSGYVLFVLSDNADNHSQVRQLLPLDTNPMLCAYLGQVVTQVEGFSSQAEASAWGQQVAQTTGLQAVVIDADEIDAAPPTAVAPPPPMTSPANPEAIAAPPPPPPQISTDATRTETTIAAPPPPPPQISSGAPPPPPPSLPSFGSIPSPPPPDRAARPIVTGDYRTSPDLLPPPPRSTAAADPLPPPTAPAETRDKPQGRSQPQPQPQVRPQPRTQTYNPDPLGEGYAVLVDFFNRPNVATQLRTATGQDVGLASYGGRPYLLVSHTTDEGDANELLRDLSDRGFWVLVVDSRRVVAISDRVNTP